MSSHDDETMPAGAPEPKFGPFEFLDRGTIRPATVSEAARAMGKAMGEHRVFEINTEGSVKIHGYSVDDALKLLNGYREYMIGLGEDMQRLSSAADAVRYQPGEGGYQ